MEKKIGYLAIILFGFLLFSNCTSMMKVKLDFPDNQSILVLEENPDKYIESGPAQYLLIEEEWRIWKKEIKKIKDPELRLLAKKQFIKWVWKRRGGEKAKTEFMQRVVYAEREFHQERYGSGWRSDRGEIWIIFGPPDAKSTFTPIFGSFEDTLATWNDPTQLAETWIYNSLTPLLIEARIELQGLFEIYFRQGLHKGWELAAKIPFQSYRLLQVPPPVAYDTYVPIRESDSEIVSYYTRLLRTKEAVRKSYIIEGLDIEGDR